MQVIFFSVPGLPAVFISSAPAAEEIGFSPVRERFICFHGSVCVQIVTVIVPGLPTRCNFSIFCQFPLSIHHDPLHVGYFCSTIEGIRTSIDFCRPALIGSAPAAEVADFSGIIQSPLIGAHTSIAVQVIFISLPGLPARCNFSVFYQIPFSTFYNPLGTLYLTVCTECIASAVDSCLAALISAAPAPEVIDRSIRINHPLICFHGSICIQIITFSIPGLPAGLFCTVFVKIPIPRFFDPTGLNCSFYRLRGCCWEQIICGRCAYCKAQAKNYHR